MRTSHYGDTDAEVEALRNSCKDKGTPFAVSYGFEKGGKGVTELAFWQ